MRDQPPGLEHRLFQLVVIISALVPISAGVDGIWRGPVMIRGIASSSPDLESHFRYLSGLLLGIGLAFVFSVLDIQRRASLFRVLGMIVIAAGLARLTGVILLGLPGPAHLFGLAMEVGVMPALMLWLGRIDCLERGDR